MSEAPHLKYISPKKRKKCKERNDNIGRPPKVININKMHLKADKKTSRSNIEKNLTVQSNFIKPTTLSKEASIEWDRITNLYSEMPAKVISSLDTSLLISYCEAVAIYKEAQKVWKKYNKIYDIDANKNEVIKEAIKTMNKQTEIIAKCSSELLLTPVGRAKMGLNPADKEIQDNLDKLFAKFGE